VTSPSNTDGVVAQILSCLDAAAMKPGLVKASVHQTEGYLRGIQGLAWETPALTQPPPQDRSACFLFAVRKGDIALRGRIKKTSHESLLEFQKGFCVSFPQASGKPFLSALSKLWARWAREDDDFECARQVGEILKAEYDEGIAGELSAYLLDDRLHLRPVRDYLRMRGWLQGTIEHLRQRPDWESRETAQLLQSNFSSVVLRALHNADVGYAASVVEKLPLMRSQLDQATAHLAANEPEAAHFLRKNRLTILTRALHSGYLDYPSEAARDLPKTLRDINERIGALEHFSPEEARQLRTNMASLVYRALTNGKLSL